ncbi:MAG: PEP-CTERM sorting domain-containing protein [Isosphaeraceae bacterium]
MSHRNGLISLAALGLALSLSAAPARADFLIGGTYQLELTNAPVTATTTQTLNLVANKTVASNLMLTEKIYQDGPNAQWVEFNFRTIDGGPLAGNFNAGWQTYIRSIDLTGPGRFTDFYVYFSHDGTPFSPLNPFFGVPIAPIPTNPSLGPAWVGSIPNPQPQTTIDLFTQVSPYSFLANSGVNINTANSYTIAGRVAAVPEPSSVALTGLGLAGLGLLGRRLGRSNRAAR